jgi:predicted negative regulator of RcsB-dependent stress response
MPVLLLLVFLARPLHALEEGGSFTYRFERSDYQELRLPPGQRFSVILEGTSWYINRYDRVSLAFNLRKVGTDSVEFVLTTGQPSTAYILFSSVEGDLYVRVFVEEEAGTGPGEEEEAGTGPGEEEETRREPGGGTGPPQDGGYDRPAPAEERQPREPGGIYYLDDEGKAVQVPVRTEETAFQRGISSLEAGMLDEARRQLSDYLAECTRCSRRVDALVALAEVHRRSGRRGEALDSLGRAVARAEGERAVSILLDMADLHLEEGRLEEAAALYREAYRTGGDPVHLESAGDLYFQQQRYREAAAVYQESLQAGRESAQLLYRLAVFFDLPGEIRDIQNAYRYYRRVVQDYPDSSRAGEARERVRFFEEHFYRYR